MSFPPVNPENPFAAPQSIIGDRSFVADIVFDSDAERIRLEHLSHESSIKSIGLLCYLTSMFGVLFAIGGILSATGLLKGNAPPPNTSPELIQLMTWAGTAVWATVAILGIAQGLGLRSLQVWARWLTLVLTALSLLFGLMMAVFMLTLLGGNNAVPLLIVVILGVTILGYEIFLLATPKSNMVFSGEYRNIIQQTPGIVCRSSLLIKILVGLVTALVVLVFFAMIATAFR